MIFLFYGNDAKKVAGRARQATQEFLAGRPNAGIHRLDEENFEQYQLKGLIGQSGLFQKETLVIFSRLLGRADFRSAVERELKRLAESRNLFIFLEDDLDPETGAAFKTHCVCFERLSAPLKEAKFNPFSITEAYGRRARKALWLNFQRGLLSGLTAEEIHGLLFWQVKSILLAQTAANLKESELKPFVYQKAKKFAQNFTLAELQSDSSALVDLYHNSRRNSVELAPALERFILKSR